MNGEIYYYWNKRIDIELYSIAKSIAHIYHENGVENSSHIINKTAVDIILSFNGMQTYDVICKMLSQKYKDTVENVRLVIEDFLEEMKKRFGVELMASNVVVERGVKTFGEENYYPKAASIEITQKCNMQCIHCYGNFGPTVNNEMSLQQIKKLVDDLRSVGVEVIELTGGDISVHKELYEILRYTSSKGFRVINLLTNGMAVEEKILDYIIQNKDKFVVQIDLHSLNDEYYEWFTKRKNVVEKVKKTILYLANNGVQVRIVTILTSRNLNEMMDIAKWVDNIRQTWGAGLVEHLGRACLNEETKALYLSQDEMQKYIQSITNIVHQYPRLIRQVRDEDASVENNCGALSSQVCISVEGSIKLCIMSDAHDFAIGNVFNECIKDIYDTNKEFIVALADYETPTQEAKECIGCEYQYKCIHCLIKNIEYMKKKNFECDWWRKKVNNKLAQKIKAVNEESTI